MLLTRMTKNKHENITIKLINQLETYDFRRIYLRNNTSDKELYMWDEEHESAQQFHIGAFCNNGLVGIASAYEQNIDDKKNCFRIRGLGVIPLMQQHGIATDILKEIINTCSKLKAKYIWCNSRVEVTNFYQRNGFKIISEPFDIPKIGSVVKMIKTL